MRTTLSTDDDILLTAKHLAKRDRKTVGEVISDVARSHLLALAYAHGGRLPTMDQKLATEVVPGEKMALELIRI
jgi:hypothetical protein